MLILQEVCSVPLHLALLRVKPTQGELRDGFQCLDRALQALCIVCDQPIQCVKESCGVKTLEQSILNVDERSILMLHDCCIMNPVDGVQRWF